MSKMEEIKVTCNDDIDVVFAVNHELIKDKDWHAFNNFFSDADWRLSEAEGDIVLATLMLIAGRCCYVQVSGDLNVFGVMKAFDYKDREGQEGFPLLDGSSGILLKYIDTIEFNSSLTDIRRKPITEMPSAPAPT